MTDAAAITRALEPYAISQWLGVVPHPYVAWHARKFLGTAAIAEGIDGDIPRVITLRANPRILIGLVGLRQTDPLTLSLGYWIAGPFQGFGVATEAARALIDFAFTERAIETITATVLPDNVASQRVLAAAGLRRQFRRELMYVRGRHRKHWVHTYRLDRHHWWVHVPPG